MRAKPCIVGCTLLLALTAAAGAKHFVLAASASPAVSGNASTAQWKSVSEDSASWRREPFTKSEGIAPAMGSPAKPGATGASPDISLQGIMKSNKRYYAIINGRTVKPGDYIDEWKVVEISSYRITIRREKEKQIYDIYQGRIERGTR